MAFSPELSHRHSVGVLFYVIDPSRNDIRMKGVMMWIPSSRVFLKRCCVLWAAKRKDEKWCRICWASQTRCVVMVWGVIWGDVNTKHHLNHWGRFKGYRSRSWAEKNHTNTGGVWINFQQGATFHPVAETWVGVDLSRRIRVNAVFATPVGCMICCSVLLRNDHR